MNARKIIAEGIAAVYTGHRRDPELWTPEAGAVLASLGSAGIVLAHDAECCDGAGWVTEAQHDPACDGGGCERLGCPIAVQAECPGRLVRLESDG